MSCFFSIIIPLYNKERFINTTIQSVLNQDFKDYEIIIINDGSTDNSLEIVRSFNDERIRIIDQENQGLSAARNKGIELAYGKITALLDADDIWLPNYLAEIKKLHDTFPEASIFSTSYLEKYSNKLLIEPQRNIDEAQKEKRFVIDDFYKANLKKPILCPSSTCFIASRFNRKAIFDVSITFAEDIEFYLQHCGKQKVAYHNEALVIKNCAVPNQMTRTEISTKNIPDLDCFENKAKHNESLKRYLDQCRYIFAHLYKLERNFKKKRDILKNVDLKNLSSKQRFLLSCPWIICKALNLIKSYIRTPNFKIS